MVAARAALDYVSRLLHVRRSALSCRVFPQKLRVKYPSPDSVYAIPPQGSVSGRSDDSLYTGGVYVRLDIVNNDKRVCSVPVELPPKVKLPGTTSPDRN